MSSILRRAIGVLSAASFFVLLLGLTPTTARAQYELTFDPASCGYPPDPPLTTCSDGRHITPSYGTQGGIVGVTNGILPGFGNATTLPTNTLFSGLFWAEGGCCGLAVTDGLARPGDLNGFAGTEVGAIQFALVSPYNAVTLTSLMIGASNVKTDGTTQTSGTLTSAEVRIYDIVTGLLLFDQTNTFKEGQNLGVPTTFSPNICSGNGVVVEWAAGSTNPISIESYGINNVFYDVSQSGCPSTGGPEGTTVTPEPGVMSLLAFGLVGLAPLARRRRRAA